MDAFGRFYDNENGDCRNDACTVSEKDRRKHVEEVEERLHLAVVALADGQGRVVTRRSWGSVTARRYLRTPNRTPSPSLCEATCLWFRGKDRTSGT